jgi:RNA polymerase primary sigma factor
VFSLDVPLSKDSDETFLDRFEDAAIKSPVDIISVAERCAELRRWLDLLDEKERQVLSLRFGLEGDAETLESIGRMFGVTRERVRQIEVRALEKLKRFMYCRNITSLDSI